ncbi:hypothetical protein J7T55_014705 [Diaporthe amygdali]|uniref:uncharacterized protein n=1 Tax=Phomopsis amygdali TaxID=1214568 RepID=UPI0022FED2B4|nr:uncharacterized protein J7T55_014705 [Diaporthe amygdali]KAJ0107175.1 hypothetical protein J7T55_014705 [Diaporthe amygdali]
MAFAPSFGSFGDFLSIAILIKDIVLALDDCRGSSNKYQELKQGLEILGETIRHVEHAYQNPTLVVYRDTSTTAIRVISRIHQCLADFNSQKLQKYATSLSPGGSGNPLKDVARKIQFKFDEKDIENFQREIIGYNMLLTTLMEVSTMHTIERNNDNTTKQISAIASQTQELQQQNGRNSRYLVNFGKKVFARLNFLSRLATDIQKSTTQVLSLVFTISTGVAELRSMIMKIEWPLGGEHFILEDATGRAFPIPLKTVTSWDLFEYILQEHFKGRTGAHRVLRRRYLLSERTTSTDVERTTAWENAFRPYQRIDMSIMCKAAATEIDLDQSSTCPFCGRMSTSGMDVQVKCQNCNMFYRRIVNLEEDEDSLMAAPMPPQQQRAPQFGQPSFGPTPPQDLWRKRRRSRDPESEGEGTCNECHRPKRSKYQGNNKRKAVDEAESGSDEEDYRGLSRITLVSRRKRLKESKNAFADFWATDTNGVSFTAYAQESSPMPAAHSQDLPDRRLLWSRPEDGWKWSEKAIGENAALKTGVDSENPFSDSGISSPEQSEQSRHASEEKDDGNPSDEHGSSSLNEKQSGTSDASYQYQERTPSPSRPYYYYSESSRRPSTRAHYSRYASTYSTPPPFSPRYTSDGYYSASSIRDYASTKDKNQDKNVKPGGTTSADPERSSWRRYRRSSYSYYREDDDAHNHEDENEYVEVNGVTYVIPAKSKSKRHHYIRDDDSESYGVFSRFPAYPDGHKSPRHAAEPRRRRAAHSVAAQPKAPPAKAPLVKSKATDADAKRHGIPAGYSLKNWDPDEEPILLLGSVFDANTLGKWIYDWTVHTHGVATPVSEMAGELWLLLIQMAGKKKRSEETVPRIRSSDGRELVEDFIESGERLFDKLRKVLKICEKQMLSAAKNEAKETRSAPLASKTGTEFVKTIFGKERELEKTERFMQSVRLWNMRFDANCEDIIKRPTQ